MGKEFNHFHRNTQIEFQCLSKKIDDCLWIAATSRDVETRSDALTRADRLIPAFLNARTKYVFLKAAEDM